LLRSDDAGRAAIVVAAAATDAPPRETWPAPPAGLRYAADAVTPPAHLAPAVAALLDRILLVADAGEAARAIEGRPGLRAVTRDGDVFGAVLVRGGSSSAPSLLEVQAAVDEAAESLAEAAAAGKRAAADLAEAKQERAGAAGAVEEITARRRAADKRRNEIAQQVGKLGGQARSAAAEVERYTAAAAKAAAGRTSDLDTLADLERRLAEAEAEPVDDGEPDTERRDALAESAAAARSAEMEGRLAVRT
ncbi:chromosome segregation protein SMC, partial [Nocardiopsis sediminis]